ncbi:tRNA (guanine(37)-N1)-methyltransferase 2 [Hibiscus syriacus]|uniref:tRNA (guanine(37)-N1)-methyltransferase n=1 Tax=Hibiscus syriacus TaxID=106335 RepID=A0A6A2YK96_HIBSY|nr:tRNA (guanine(37)-N1)-methyltransferase 1 isoform X2 [Hibiscus syriacus]KAE8680169.1 tRNA (guanine(37)-N1)-methyltransferase 2 [Hibiscus syriacus]
MVAIKLMHLKPNSLLPFTNFPFKHSFSSLPKPSILSLLYSTQSQIKTQNFSYGPSLHKGKIPLETPSQTQIQTTHQPEVEEGNDPIFDEQKFARVFHLAALRVPANDCFALENRLRGHLLNWPRVKNIARVPGDEIDEEMMTLFDKRNDGEEGGEEEVGEFESLVLYREKLVKEFNYRGFVKFTNLAKISRPGKRKKKGSKGDGERKGNERKVFCVVEVLEEKEGEDEMKGLLGEEFKGGREWKGSTRLLLLDERYGDKGFEELPQAIKAVLVEETRENTSSTIELVRCKLTLFYDYWQMNEILETLLPEGMIIPSAFETVGHIAHLNLKDEHLPYKNVIAKVVLDKNKPKIQTVVNKIDAIQNDYRTMQLEVLAGNHSLVTTVVENGLRFRVDLAKVYWNSRLGTERQRLLSGFNRNDVICDVFSGVGPIAISAAKIVKRVYANDLNPFAVEYLERNSVLNKLERKIKIFNMDGRRFINAMFSSEKAHSITHVVMNLPNDAAEFLDAFRGVYRDQPRDNEFNFPMIHVYGFSKARDPEFDFHERIRIALQEVEVNVDMSRVRLVAPGKYMFCASFILPRSVAFAERSLNV